MAGLRHFKLANNIISCTGAQHPQVYRKMCGTTKAVKDNLQGMEPIVVIHGGIGDNSGSRIHRKIAGTKIAIQAAYKILKDGGSAVDAVESAIRFMEHDENFNAGYGSVLNIEGEVAMDASIMNGENLKAGAVTLVQDVRHPITLARKVMENTPYTFLGAHGAHKFARAQSMPIVDPKSLITDYARARLEEFKRTGDIWPEAGGSTVGAVALDKNGHLAAGTSTGGMDGKMVGRIGDTPLIGCGTYADDLYGAVSATGHGESILKYCLTHEIITELKHGKSAFGATKDVVDGMTKRLKNIAGAITLSKNGDVGIYFTSERLLWGWQKKNEIHYGIKNDEEKVYTVYTV